jgi:hypothetical protein
VDHAGEQQLAPHRPVDGEEYPHEGTIITGSVNQIWGTDMTQTISTDEGRDYVVITVDHCSGELIGTDVSSNASRWEVLKPIRQRVARRGSSVR